MIHALERALPAAVDVERLILGAILTDEAAFVQVAGNLEADDFSIETHRRIFARMRDLNERGEKIERMALTNELKKQGQFESVGGIGYLVSLDEGMPQIFNLEGYVRIVKDKAILRRVIFTSQSIADRCYLGLEDPAEILTSAEESLLRLGDDHERERDALLTPGQIVRRYEGGIDAFLNPARHRQGLSTGFPKFDELTGGLQSGDLILLAGRPSMGKTALALNIAQHVAGHPSPRKPVAIFSLEMSSEALLTRMVCTAARMDQQKFRAGYLNADERRRLQVATTDLSEAPVFIDDRASIGLMEIHAKLRRLKAEHGVGLVIVDYLQLMTGRGRFENRNQEVSYLSRGFKLMAKELNVPILVLSQLSRAPETRGGDHRPQLSDLRESGSLEQDADLVAFIYREEYYKPEREDLRGRAELMIAKQRNGPIGRVKLVFLKEFTKFENLATDLDASPGALAPGYCD